MARAIDAEERFLSLVVANFDARRKRTPAGTNMNTFVSLSIALGIVALGLWAVVAAGSLLWMIPSLLPVIVGLISLFDAARNESGGTSP